MGRRKQSIVEHFESKVIRKNGCWDWSGGMDKDGYARSSCLGLRRANRLSWTICNGPIPEGMLICHKCDNRRCTNPEHLFVGTSKENNQDMIKKQRDRCVSSENAHSAKLSKNDVLEIRSQLMENEVGIRLAKKYKVTPGLISMIKNEKIWRNI